MMATKHFQWRINGKLTLLCVLFLPLLLNLGFWQLSRAKQKQTLQESWHEQQALPAVALNELDVAENGRRVFVQGQFEPVKYWLLENKIFDDHLGYDVVMAFQSDSGQWLLVNRGWLPASQYRTENPELITPEGPIRLTGTLTQPSDSRLVKQVDDGTHEWPKRLLEVDPALMTKQVGHELAGRLLLLDADSVAALAVNWQPVTLSPATHKGYAVQWFAMAFALTVLWLMSNSNVMALIRQDFNGNDNDDK